MPLNDYRKQADVILVPLAKKFIKVHPNNFSALAILSAVLAGVAYYLGGWYLMAAFVLISLNALFDALDGKIARMTKNTTRQGDFLDHILDRYSDVVITLGIMYSAYGHVTWGVFAIIGTLMTSYMGTQAEASGGKRERGGLLGRADRLVIIILLPLAQGALLYFKIGKIYGMHLTAWVLLFLAIAGNYTALRRFQLTWPKLAKGKYSGEKL